MGGKCLPVPRFCSNSCFRIRSSLTFRPQFKLVLAIFYTAVVYDNDRRECQAARKHSNKFSQLLLNRVRAIYLLKYQMVTWLFCLPCCAVYLHNLVFSMWMWEL